MDNEFVNSVILCNWLLMNVHIDQYCPNDYEILLPADDIYGSMSQHLVPSQ